MRSLRANPGMAALAGMSLLLPFALMNAIVANRVDPFFSWIRPGMHTSPQEYVLLSAVLLLLPAGAAIALRPLMAKGPDGTRRFHLLNALVAASLLLVFAALAAGLGSDIYACDILQVPNCD